MTRGIQGIELGPYYNDNMTMKKERKLTAAEKKKREEIAKAIERDNPGMDMSRKMAIATATAKKSTKEGLFFGKKGPAVVSRLARGVASRVTTKGKLDRAKKKNQKIQNKIDLIKTKKDIKKNKANLRTLQKSSTNEEVPGNAVAQGGVNMAPNMGPRVKAINVTDRRRRKDKQPIMLKRFRTYMDER